MGIPIAICTFLVAISYSAILVLAQTEKNPTVTIKHGQIEGETLKSIKGREYSAFAGIPYAKPPIGDLRFEAPEPIEPWEGMLKTTTKNATHCPQASFFKNELIGDEDCLFINVYTPKLADQSISSLPVMVFIHGGGYFAGSGNFIEYGAQRLMDRDVVLVTLNYRLGPLGFLATSHEDFAGNYGLLDQIAALKWVQENIEAFGGNKSKVTIFGESAGAGSVTLLLLSPLAKDLFHGAIAQSGSALCPWGVNHYPTTCTKFLSVKLNCTTFPIESMKECLRNKTWEQILTKSKGSDVFNGFPIIHKPNIDKKVVPDDPKVLFQEGKLNKVPVILGINKDEGAGMFAAFRQWYPRTGEDYFKEDFPELLVVSTDMSLASKLDEIVDKVRDRYFKNVDMSNKTQFSHTMAKVYGDAMFACAQRTAKYLANTTDFPTYVYTFSHRGNSSFVSYLLEPGEDLGVSHADDLQYLFGSEYFKILNLTENDEKMSEIFLSLWSNFATVQNPTPAEGGIKMPFIWPPYETKNPKCIDLNLNSTETDKCEPEHTGLWADEIPDLLKNK